MPQKSEIQKSEIQMSEGRVGEFCFWVLVRNMFDDGVIQENHSDTSAWLSLVSQGLAKYDEFCIVQSAVAQRAWDIGNQNHFWDGNLAVVARPEVTLSSPEIYRLCKLLVNHHSSVSTGVQMGWEKFCEFLDFHKVYFSQEELKLLNKWLWSDFINGLMEWSERIHKKK